MSDILNDDEIAALAVTADQDAAPTDTPPADTPPADDRPRDEQGRFIQKTPDPTPEGEPQPEGEQRQVPQQALHAEREKRKGVEAQLKSAQEQLAQIAALKAKIAQAPAPEQPQADPADDTNGVEHLKARIAKLEGHTQNTQRQQQLAQADDYEMQVLAEQATADEETFRAVQPDYDDAISYLVGARARELSRYGLRGARLEAQIREEAADMVRAAVSMGQSPAEFGYQTALDRGYRPAQGGQQAPQQQVPANPAQATLDAIAKGRAMSKTPGQGGGGAPTELNATTIAAMSDDEFNALYATPEGRKLIDAL